jgi:hypothetical protein
MSNACGLFASHDNPGATRASEEARFTSSLFGVPELSSSLLDTHQDLAWAKKPITRHGYSQFCSSQTLDEGLTHRDWHIHCPKQGLWCFLFTHPCSNREISQSGISHSDGMISDLPRNAASAFNKSQPPMQVVVIASDYYEDASSPCHPCWSNRPVGELLGVPHQHLESILHCRFLMFAALQLRLHAAW